MPEPGTDLASGRRWWGVRRELVVVIALQVAGAGAGVAAALAAGGAGPALRQEVPSLAWPARRRPG
jgi:hypothetical protein